jgi:RNA polymerase sigma-70 factor, ECF subfamily
MDRSTQPAANFSPELQSLVAELHAACGAERFNLSCDQLTNILVEVAQKYAVAAGLTRLPEFCFSLKIEELVLARACANGDECAWETFMARYGDRLYEMGLQIAREESAARELADSLYADLYGTGAREGQRVSKLASYTGRGSLEGWLRTVMAQEHVNRYRRQKRMVSLDEETEEGTQFATLDPGPPAVLDPRLESATDEALSALPAEDRFILAAYYLDGRTLAEIGRVLGLHESTVSRKVDKLAKSLRKQILAALGRRGMSRRQSEEALEVDVRDLSLNIRDLCSAQTPSASKKRRSRGQPSPIPRAEILPGPGGHRRNHETKILL